MLPRDEPYPGRKVASVLELAGVADRSHDGGCGHRSDSDDRLGIVAIVLVGLDERCDVLRADEANVEALAPKNPRPVMGRAARLHNHELRVQASDRLKQRWAANLRTMHDNARPRCAMKLE